MYQRVARMIEYSRQRGNTTILAEAALKAKAILVVADRRTANRLASKYPGLQTRCLADVTNDFYLGRREPILVDNHVIFMISEREARLSRVVEAFTTFQQLMKGALDRLGKTLEEL